MRIYTNYVNRSRNTRTTAFSLFIILTLVLVSNTVGTSRATESVLVGANTQYYGAGVYKKYSRIIGGKGVGTLLPIELNDMQKVWTYIAIVLLSYDGTYNGIIEAGLIRAYASPFYYDKFFITIKRPNQDMVSYYFGSMNPGSWYEITIQKCGYYSDDWVIIIYNKDTDKFEHGFMIEDVFGSGNKIVSEVESNEPQIPLLSNYLVDYWYFLIYAKSGDSYSYRPFYQLMIFDGTSQRGL